MQGQKHWLKFEAQSPCEVVRFGDTIFLQRILAKPFKN